MTPSTKLTPEEKRIVKAIQTATIDRMDVCGQVWCPGHGYILTETLLALVRKLTTPKRKKRKPKPYDWRIVDAVYGSAASKKRKAKK